MFDIFTKCFKRYFYLTRFGLHVFNNWNNWSNCMGYFGERPSKIEVAFLKLNSLKYAHVHFLGIHKAAAAGQNKNENWQIGIFTLFCSYLLRQKFKITLIFMLD